MFPVYAHLVIRSTFPSEVENTIDKSLQYCEKIASKLNSVNQLPQACHKYASVVERIEDEQKSMNQAFAGMHAGAAQRAKVNRLKGYETQAQFQRRMTRSHKMSGSSYWTHM